MVHHHHRNCPHHHRHRHNRVAAASSSSTSSSSTSGTGDSSASFPSGSSKSLSVEQLVALLPPKPTPLDHVNPRTEQLNFTRLMEMTKEKKRLTERKQALTLLAQFNNSDLPKIKNTNTTLREILDNQSDDNIIKLNIGGTIFTTTLKTLNQRENMLKTMINSEFQIDRDENGCMVLQDRNPQYFPIILEHIRTGSTKYIGLWEEYPTEDSIVELRNLLEESDYFGTQKLSNIVALKINQDVKILTTSGGRHHDHQEETKEETKNAEVEAMLLRDVVNLTQHEKEVADKFIEDAEKELVKLREELKELDEKIEKPTKKFNVRGVQFEIGIEKLTDLFDCVLTAICREHRSDEVLFIDRDPSTFEIIVEYLNTRELSVIPKEITKRKMVYKMAKEFSISPILQHFDPLRFPYELLGETNLKIKKDEDFLRELFSNERTHPILQDPNLHLIEVFNNTPLFQKRELPPTIATLFDFDNEKETEELCKYSQATKPTVPQMCNSLETFQNQFDAFTCFLFKDLNWDNIVCAGGGILNCMLQPEIKETPKSSNADDLPETVSYDDPDDKAYWTEDDESNDDSDSNTPEDADDYFTSSGDEEYLPHITKPRFEKKPVKIETPEQKLYNHYQNNNRKSDIDIFLYDLDEKQAKAKIVYIYEHLKKQLENIPLSSFLKDEKSRRKDEYNDILIIRTQNAITFVPHPRFRKIQIILRIYKSPSEVLIGFDVNDCCVGYDGKQVLALPRAVQAIATRCNIVDPDRQSNTYETRLVKYALRGFKIGVPGFSEKKITNRILTDKNSLKTNWSYVKTTQQAEISQVSGLARILLIRHAMKNCQRKRAALWSVGGGRTLETTEMRLNVRPYYQDITSQFAYYNTPRFIHTRLQDKFQGISRYGSRAPLFQTSLNDIKPIVEPHSAGRKKQFQPFTTLSFITVNPGTQTLVGSFYPHSKNFLQDAYSDPTRNKKTLNKYYWRDGNKLYPKDISKKLETQYRALVKTGSVKYAEFPLSEKEIIDFRGFAIYEVSNGMRKKCVGNVFRTKDSKKVVKRNKFVPQINHQAVLFGEEEQQQPAVVVESAENEEKLPYPVAYRNAGNEQQFKSNLVAFGGSGIGHHLYGGGAGGAGTSRNGPFADSEEEEEDSEEFGDDDDDYYDDDEDDEDEIFNSQAINNIMMNSFMQHQQHHGGGAGGGPPQCPQQ